MQAPRRIYSWSFSKIEIQGFFISASEPKLVLPKWSTAPLAIQHTAFALFIDRLKTANNLKSPKFRRLHSPSLHYQYVKKLSSGNGTAFQPVSTEVKTSAVYIELLSTEIIKRAERPRKYCTAGGFDWPAISLTAWRGIPYNYFIMPKVKERNLLHGWEPLFKCSKIKVVQNW